LSSKPGNPPPPWFWGSTKKPTTGFEAKPGETVAISFEAKLEKTVAVDFEAKPVETVQPWFWGSTKKPVLLVATCTVQTEHDATQPLDRPATEYPTYVTIPGPL
jgi:hypothetical protein